MSQEPLRAPSGLRQGLDAMGGLEARATQEDLDAKLLPRSAQAGLATPATPTADSSQCREHIVLHVRCRSSIGYTRETKNTWGQAQTTCEGGTRRVDPDILHMSFSHPPKPPPDVHRNEGDVGPGLQGSRDPLHTPSAVRQPLVDVSAPTAARRRPQSASNL